MTTAARWQVIPLDGGTRLRGYFSFRRLMTVRVRVEADGVATVVHPQDMKMLARGAGWIKAGRGGFGR